jgi:hypothetical protein
VRVDIHIETVSVDGRAEARIVVGRYLVGYVGEGSSEIAAREDAQRLVAVTLFGAAQSFCDASERVHDLRGAHRLRRRSRFPGADAPPGWSSTAGMPVALMEEPF